MYSPSIWLLRTLALQLLLFTEMSCEILLCCGSYIPRQIWLVRTLALQLLPFTEPFCEILIPDYLGWDALISAGCHSVRLLRSPQLHFPALPVGQH